MAIKTINQLDDAAIPIAKTDKILVSRDGINVAKTTIDSLPTIYSTLYNWTDYSKSASDEISNLINSGAENIYFHKSRDIKTSTSVGYYKIDKTVDIPWYCSLLGVGPSTTIRFPDDPNLTTLFRLNTDGVTWGSMQYPASTFTRIENMFVTSISGANVTQNVTFATIGGPVNIDNLHIGNVTTVIKQPNLYIDSVRINRLNTYETKYVDDNTYIIDLPYTGDAVNITQSHFYRPDMGTPNDGTDDKRPRAIRVKYKSTVKIDSIIGGDILVDSCTQADISNLHHEVGIVTFKDSSGTLSNSVFWNRGESYGDLSITPIHILNNQDSISKSNNVAIKNCSVVYQYYFPCGYSTSKTNLQISTGYPTYPAGKITIENYLRDTWSNLGAYITPNRCGVITGYPEFDNYSHFASVNSEFSGRRWVIEANAPSLPTSATGIDTANSGLLGDGTTTLSGTYYYKAQLLLDKKRKVGITGSAEKSFVLTTGGSSPSIILSSEFNRQGIVRLYRGTSSGSYSNYVDLPLVSGGRFFDVGDNVSGFPWLTRTVSGVDSINNISVLNYTLSPADNTTSSDSYGIVSITGRNTSTYPTTGAWRKGDRIVIADGAKNNAYRFRGWKRLTDCLESSSTNVLGTDWEEIWEQYSSPLATSSNFLSATDTVNTVFKLKGNIWMDSSTGKFITPSGSSATSTWVDASGNTIYTPT